MTSLQTSSLTLAEGRLHNALVVLEDNDSAHNTTNLNSITTYHLALSFLNYAGPPLYIYQAASCLTEGQIREVVQFLTFLGPKAGSAAVRLLTIMKGLPGNLEMSLLFLDQQKPDIVSSFSERILTLFALLCGRKIYGLCDWSSIINKAFRHGHSESQLALTAASDGIWHGPIESVRRVFEWATEEEHAASPSIWRELEWASYTRHLSVKVGIITTCMEKPSQNSSNESQTKVEVFTNLQPSVGTTAVHFVRACGILVRRRSVEQPRIHSDPIPSTSFGSKPVEGSGNSFIVTASIESILREMVVSITYGMSFILEGPSGCGKTSILALLARETMYDCQKPSDEGNIPGVTFIQMDSAMIDAEGESLSSLVGGVVPLPEGGGFRWRPGPIGLAIERGEWIVFENIEKVVSSRSSAVPIITQLARAEPGDTIDAPGRGEPIRVRRGFRCIATRTTYEGCKESLWAPPGGWSTWRRLSMTGLTRLEKVNILEKRFGQVKDCVERVVKATEKVAIYTHEHRGPLLREPTMREIVRICKRLEATRNETGELSVETALLETFDVLAAWCPSEVHREHLTSILTTCWSVPIGIGLDLVSQYRPTFLNLPTMLRLGRVHFPKLLNGRSRSFSRLALTGHTLRLLERILRCLQVDENVLLTGETGSGKTALVQELASLMNKRLIVLNLSRQSELGDLVGGFRPVHMTTAVPLLAKTFEDVFCKCVSRQKNITFLDALQKASRSSGQHSRALRLMKGAVNAIPKETRNKSPAILRQWNAVISEISKIELSLVPIVDALEERELDSNMDHTRDVQEPPKKRMRSSSNNDTRYRNADKIGLEAREKEAVVESRRRVEFSFSEGVLVRAMRDGDWVLMDEVNLAPPELLERLVSVVDRGEITLSNEGGETVSQSKGFTLFGAMNPPTDVGKRPLPAVLRSRFSEIFVGDTTSHEDLVALVLHRFFQVETSFHKKSDVRSSEESVAHDVASFYLQCCSLAADGRVEDTTGKPVRYSLRMFSRMLDFASGIRKCMKSGFTAIRRALYEGAMIAFATPLPSVCRSEIVCIANSHLLLKSSGRNGSIEALSDMMTIPPNAIQSVRLVEGFPVEMKEDLTKKSSDGDNVKFVVSPAVQKTLKDVCRAMLIGAPQLPILLQGPTAAGKTSLVTYLAELTGNKLTRINNHEHTDISEYIGGYVATSDGCLVFREGPLVRSARNGDWIMLDELNLAPPDVLESLNRLLDDNREIFLPETGEVVKAASGFRLFATQNPPGLYGGRKELSRAFRSRFIEMQVDELPDADLLTILELRSCIPKSFAKKMVVAMRELQMRRRESGLFCGREGYATARDIFRWASRHPKSKEELAVHGFFLLGERSRKPAERETVRTVLIKSIGVEPKVLDDVTLYSFESCDDEESAAMDCLNSSLEKLSLSCDLVIRALTRSNIIPTPSMRRMMVLLIHSIANKEPALLVGNTGGGKTSSCSALCNAMTIRLLTVNCHRNTEASDILGGFRPVRRRRSGDPLFEWSDGPLVKAMKQGAVFLLDEINMADDAVIERLNSVLEVERTLLLSEKGATNSSTTASSSLELVLARSEFRIVATMNPGGDFGKKELSPALRNRFTEIWIPSPCTLEEFSPIIESRLGKPYSNLSSKMEKTVPQIICNFLAAYLPSSMASSDMSGSNNAENGMSQFPISLRDVSAWCDFIQGAVENCKLDPISAIVHGARLVFLDGFLVGSTNLHDKSLEHRIWNQLLSLFPESARASLRYLKYKQAESIHFERRPLRISKNICLKVDCFNIKRNDGLEARKMTHNVSSFSFSSPNTIRNTARLARAMSVGCRPILLEGPPGCGKTSLIAALANLSEFPFVRINLSDSTEMSDLVGSDTPGQKQGSFVFRKGPLLKAILNGSWVLLDELNLASQSVLEGLNSVLDHRKSIFIPETNEVATAHASFRIFGAQNPALEGGGRRGLPKSFLNRFTRVQIETPEQGDILAIVKAMNPIILEEVAQCIVATLEDVNISLHLAGCSGGRFGLRDALRWCDLLSGVSSRGTKNSFTWHPDFASSPDHIGAYFDVTVLQSLKKGVERSVAEACFEKKFGFPWKVSPNTICLRSARRGYVRIGLVTLNSMDNFSVTQQSESASSTLLPSRFRELQALSCAVNAGWPAILFSNSGAVSSLEARHLVEQIATMYGKRIRTVYGGSLIGCDDFVGGYSQEDVLRRLRAVTDASEEALHEVLRATVREEHCISPAVVAELLLFADQKLKELQHLCKSASQEHIRLETVNTYLHQTRCFLECLQKFCINSFNLERFLRKLREGLEDIDLLLPSLKEGKCVAFEWCKSNILTAMEEGEWIFLEGADACPPAVLDRLNPLFERSPISNDISSDNACNMNSSSFILAEAPSNEDGSPVIMQPHSNFRMFFSISNIVQSPESCGLSRALLDRALRICVSGSSSNEDRNAMALQVGLPFYMDLHAESSKAMGEVVLSSPSSVDNSVSVIRDRVMLASDCNFCMSLEMKGSNSTNDSLHKQEKRVNFKSKNLPYTNVYALSLNPLGSLIERDICSLCLLEIFPASIARKQWDITRSNLLEKHSLNLHSSSEIWNDWSLSQRIEQGALLFHGAVAFVMASHSNEELKMRAKILQEKRYDLPKDVQGIYSSVAFAAEEFLSFSSNEYALEIVKRGGYFALPMDPLYSLDKASTSLVYRNKEDTNLNMLFSRAKNFRMEILVLTVVRASWQGALRSTSTKSMFKRAKVLYELHSNEESFENSEKNFFDLIAYDVVSSVVTHVDIFKASLSCGSDWTIPKEHEWVLLFWTVKELIELMSHNLNPDVSNVISLLQRFYMVGEDIVNDEKILGISFLKVLLEKLRTLMEALKVSASRDGLIMMPKTEVGLLTEGSLFSAATSKGRVDLSVVEIDAVIKGLVSLSTDSVERDTSILSLLQKVTASVSEKKALPRLLNSHMEHWQRIAYITAISSMQSALIYTSQVYEKICGVRPKSSALLETIKNTVAQMKCIPWVHLNALVSMQRLLWIVESGASTDLQGCMRGEIQNEALRSLLAEKAEVVGSESSGTEMKDEGKRDRCGAFSSILKAAEVSSTVPFWNLNKARDEALLTSKLLIIGTYMPGGNLKQENGLLLSSLLSVFLDTKVIPGNGEAGFSHGNERSILKFLSSSIFSAMHIREGITIDEKEQKQLEMDAVSRVQRVFDGSSSVEHPNSFSNVLLCRGVAWASIGLLRIRSHRRYIQHRKGIDPSELAKASASLAFESTMVSNAATTAYTVVSQNRLGGDDANSCIPVQRMKAIHHESSATVSKAISRYVFRPPGLASFNSYERLVENVYATTSEIIARSGLLTRILSYSESSSFQGAKQEALHIYNLCKATAERLEGTGSLSHFRDVSLPMSLGLREVQYGFSCCIRACERRKLTAEEALFRKHQFFIDLTLFPRAAFESSMSPSDAIRNCIACTPSGRAVMASAGYLLDCETNQTLSSHNEVSAALGEIVVSWKRAMLYEEQETKKRSSLHVICEAAKREEVPGIGIINGLEESEEEDFLDTFNPMQEDFEEELLGLDLSDRKHYSHSRKSPDHIDVDRIKINANDFWVLHKKLYPSKRCLGSISKPSNARHQTIQTLSCELFSLSSGIHLIIDDTPCIWELFSSNCVADSFDVLPGGLLASPSGVPSTSDRLYNFYKDSNSAEVLKASDKLRSLHDAILLIQTKMFSDSGEHPVLAGVSSAIENVCKMCKRSTPLSSIIVGVENVLRKADEWQRLFAVRSTRMDDEVSAVSRIVASWRKLEMNSWPLLLDGRAKRYEDRASQWIFLLYDAVIHEALSFEGDFLEAVKQILSAMDQFMRSSPCGEFSTRLDMIHSLASHLLSFEGSHGQFCETIGTSLKGLGQYYSTYERSLVQHMSESRALIDKELSEFSRLINWTASEDLGSSQKMSKEKDKYLEYYRMKNAAERTRRKLHKLCVKFDAVLRSPVFQHLMKELSKIGLDTLNNEDVGQGKIPRTISHSQSFSKRIAISVRQLVETFSSTKKVREAQDEISPDLDCHAFSRTVSYTKKIVEFGKIIQKTELSSCDIAVQFSIELRSSIRSRVLQLRESSSQGLQAKKRSLVELLRGLQRVGLSPFENAVQIDSNFWLSVPEPSSYSNYNAVANELFYIGAQQVQRLREISDSRVRNCDVTSEEASRCRSFCGYIFHQSCLQRVELHSCFKEIEDLSAKVSVLQDIDVSGKYHCGQETWNMKSFLSVRDIIVRLRQICVDLEVSETVVSKAVTSCKEMHSESGRENLDMYLQKFHSISTKKDLKELSQILQASVSSIKGVILNDTILQLNNEWSRVFKFLDGGMDKLCEATKASLVKALSDLEDLLNRAYKVSLHNTAVTVLRPIVRFLCSSIESLSLMKLSSLSIGNEKFDDILKDMKDVAEVAVNRILISSQKIILWSNIDVHSKSGLCEKNSLSIGKTEVFPPALLKTANSKVLNLHASLGLTEILVLLKQNAIIVNRLMRIRGGLTPKQLMHVLVLQKNLGHFLRTFLHSMVLPCAEKCAQLHCHLLALLRTLSSAFVGVCKEGYCRPSDQEKLEEGDEVDARDGVGFGDAGDGDMTAAQDVSNEVEDEEQLLGIENEPKSDANKEKIEESKEHEGFEMTNDFDGQLEDLESNGEEAEQREEQQPEKDMSGEKGFGKEILDEKLWGEDGTSPEEDLERGDNETNQSPNDDRGNGTSDLVANEERTNQNKPELESHVGQENEVTRTDQNECAEQSKKGEAGDMEEENEQKDAEESSMQQKNSFGNMLEDHKNDEEGFQDGEENKSNADMELEPENDGLENGSSDLEGMDGDSQPEMGQHPCSLGEDKLNNVEEQEVGSNQEKEDEMNMDVDGDFDRDIDNDREDKGSGQKEGIMDGLTESEDADGSFDEKENECVETEKASSNPSTMDENCHGEQLDMKNIHNPAKRKPQKHEKDEDIQSTDETELENGSGLYPRIETLPCNEERSTRSVERTVGTATTAQNETRTPQDTNATIFQDRDSFGIEGSVRKSSPEEIENSNGEKGASELEGQLIPENQSKEGLLKRNTELNRSEITENRKQSNVLEDPNPLRSSHNEDLSKTWERYLEVIDRQKGSALPKDIDENKQRAGSELYEFKEQGEEDPNDMQTLGAATADQHKPIPHDETDALDNSNPKSPANSNHDDEVTNSSSPRAPTTQDVAGNELRVSYPDDKEGQEKGQEKECCDVKSHPVHTATKDVEKAGSNEEGRERKGILSKDEPTEDDMMDIENDKDLMEDVVQKDGRVELGWVMEDLDVEQAADFWRKLDAKVSIGASTLCEQLRLILEPTVASGLAGGYRTGKRLNMKKVIEYVASDFRKDRIWLRRVRPDKRSYDVLLAIDDSASMAESDAGAMALESLALVISALSKLEIGRVAVASFGAETEMVRSFDEPLPLSIERGAKLLQHFRFSQKETNVVKLLRFIYSEMGNENSSEVEHVSLVFVISDGRLSNREEVKRQLRQLKDSNVLVAFLIVDKAGEEQASIYEVRRVEYDVKGAVSVLPYMQDFPIDFYAVIQDLKSLPMLLADALRQWVEMTSSRL